MPRPPAQGPSRERTQQAGRAEDQDEVVTEGVSGSQRAFAFRWLAASASVLYADVVFAHATRFDRFRGTEIRNTVAKCCETGTERIIAAGRSVSARNNGDGPLRENGRSTQFGLESEHNGSRDHCDRR